MSLHRLQSLGAGAGAARGSLARSLAVVTWVARHGGGGWRAGELVPAPEGGEAGWLAGWWDCQGGGGHVQRREDKASRLRHIFLQSLAKRKASWLSPQHAGADARQAAAASSSSV